MQTLNHKIKAGPTVHKHIHPSPLKNYILTSWVNLGITIKSILKCVLYMYIPQGFLGGGGGGGGGGKGGKGGNSPPPPPEVVLDQ